MLTKEERAAIAERANECVAVCGSLYEVLLGHRSAGNTTYEEDMKKLLARIIDLCDTSNMLELPVDKDGEVIRIGDTVYDCECTKYEVAGHSSSSNVLLSAGRELICFKKPANELTHKQPVTAKSLAQRIRDVLRNDHSEMSPYTSRELVHIANDLERLGDNNE